MGSGRFLVLAYVQETNLDPHSAVSGETLAIFESSLRAAKISLELDIADKASKMRGDLPFVNFPDPL
jgi:hypothetical protein